MGLSDKWPFISVGIKQSKCQSNFRVITTHLGQIGCLEVLMVIL